MRIYLDLVLLLNFSLNFLLLFGAGLASGYCPRLGRLSLGAAVGALYAGLTYLPQLAFLAGFFWRGVFLLLLLTAAYGYGRQTVRPGLIFLLLSFALGGALERLTTPSFLALLGAATILCVFCRVLRGNGQVLVPVHMESGGRQVQLTALKDTGNTLKDPISGEPVLIVQQSAAEKLLPAGLSGKEATELLSALQNAAPQVKPRLVPYRAVGKEQGMLLAMRCDRVTIGGREAGTLIAFTNTVLSEKGQFRALTGGRL